MARVSVMVPAYNNARHLEPALESVLAQKGVEAEIVVVDDASVDETPAVVKRFPRVRYVRNPRNLGLPRNFSRCLELAGAPLMCLFGQDDLMEPGTLAAKVEALDLNPEAGLAFSNAGFVDDGGTRSPEVWNTDLPSPARIPGLPFLERIVLGDNPVCLSGAVFRTDLARRLGGFDTRFSQTLDWHLWMKIALHADVAFLDRPRVLYRRHSGTQSNRSDPVENIRDVWEAKIDILRRNRDRLRATSLLEDQFRVHFGKGLLASAARNAREGKHARAAELLDLCARVAPDATFLPRALLLGAVQGLCHRHVYPRRLRVPSTPLKVRSLPPETDAL